MDMGVYLSVVERIHRMMPRLMSIESKQLLDPVAWRGRFPILDSCTYLVNHSLGAMPEAARGKLNHYADQWAERGVRAWAEGWWDAPTRIGDLVGRIMNAPEGTIA